MSLVTALIRPSLYLLAHSLRNRLFETSQMAVLLSHLCTAVMRVYVLVDDVKNFAYHLSCQLNGYRSADKLSQGFVDLIR
jgi:hypothetical protein